MTNFYYIDRDRAKQNDAGAKAPDDIAQICKDMGLTKLERPTFETNNTISICHILIASWRKICKNISRAIIVYQYPFYGRTKRGIVEDFIANHYIKKLQKKNCKFITVVHDLESVRKGFGKVSPIKKKAFKWCDNVFLKRFDIVVCHNESMKKYLIDMGFKSERLIPLGIFDYLNANVRIQSTKSKLPSIAIAGNLKKNKSTYIYNICTATNNGNANLVVNLYGNGYDESIASKNMIYHGSYKPDELIENLEGDFGLVWDGETIETCSGNTGEYLKYNNPHKTSLYLASNMPVIVWNKAAIADFVLKNNVGIAVDNLLDLEDIISNISAEEYTQMLNNVKVIGERIRSGYYFKTALKECEKILNINIEQ